MTYTMLDKTGATELIKQLKPILDQNLKQRILTLYPVGTILFCDTESYDPNVCIGGTWTRSDTWVNSNGEKLVPEGGFYPRMMKDNSYVNRRVNADQWHKLTAAHLPPHTHTVNDVPMLNKGSYQANSGSTDGFKNTGTLAYTSTSAGGGAYASNPYHLEPPYFAAYAWWRTA